MTAALWPTLVTERQFSHSVIETAHWHHWLVSHTYPLRKADGTFRTPVLADGAGLPDLLLVRGPRMIWAELKTERGRLEPNQKRWLAALAACAGCETYVWRPGDFERIAEILT